LNDWQLASRSCEAGEKKKEKQKGKKGHHSQDIVMVGGKKRVSKRKKRVSKRKKNGIIHKISSLTICCE